MFLAISIQDLIQQRNDATGIRKAMLMEKSWKESFNPFDMMTDEEFVQTFRFRKETVKDINNMIRTDLERIAAKEVLSTELQILLAFAFYAVGDIDKVKISQMPKFPDDKITIAINSVSGALVNRNSDLIKFPVTKVDVDTIFQKFMDIAKFPRVCSIVDSTHIKLTNTSGYNVTKYTNSAGWQSMNVLLACDATRTFTDTSVKWAGTIPGAAIFKESKLNKLLDDASDKYGCVLLGDSTFPCLRYLMTPIQNGIV